jgi:anti-sigma-K factor RskA
MTPEEEDREALAGEYVLGTLDARAAAAVERAMATDPALRAAVAAWEARLAPLAAVAEPEAPPPGLWDRIEAALPGAAAAQAARVARPAPSPSVPRWWRVLAVASTAAACGLLALVLLPPPERADAPRMMTVLLSTSDQPAWLVEAERDGAIRLAALNAQPVPPDRVLQLWALPQGATAPTSLGLIPGAGRVTVTPTTIRPEPGMLIEITLEPPGGSPIGRPTGPILFIGRLTAAGGA